MIETAPSFIEKFGFPIAAFLIMLALYWDATRRADASIKKSDERYEALVNRFVSTTQEITNGMREALDKNTVALTQHIITKERALDLLEAQLPGRR